MSGETSIIIKVMGCYFSELAPLWRNMISRQAHEKTDSGTTVLGPWKAAANRGSWIKVLSAKTKQINVFLCCLTRLTLHWLLLKIREAKSYKEILLYLISGWNRLRHRRSTWKPLVIIGEERWYLALMGWDVLTPFAENLPFRLPRNIHLQKWQNKTHVAKKYLCNSETCPWYWD